MVGEGGGDVGCVEDRWYEWRARAVRGGRGGGTRCGGGLGGWAVGRKGWVGGCGAVGGGGGFLN